MGPCPLAGQLLADLSADVIVVDRHSEALDNFQAPNEVMQAAPAPCFSRTPSEAISQVFAKGRHTQEILDELGLSLTIKPSND